MHTCIHTYIHIYMYTNRKRAATAHTSPRSDVYMYMHTYIHTDIHVHIYEQEKSSHNTDFINAREERRRKADLYKYEDVRTVLPAKELHHDKRLRADYLCKLQAVNGCVNVCVYGCICVPILHMFIKICNACVHTYVLTYVYAQTQHIHTYTRTHTYINTYMNTYAHTQTHIHTYDAYIHTYIRTYIHTYIHTYILFPTDGRFPPGLHTEMVMRDEHIASLPENMDLLRHIVKIDVQGNNMVKLSNGKPECAPCGFFHFLTTCVGACLQSALSLQKTK